MPNDIEKQWRLKKAEDGSVYGPIDGIILKGWADSAQVAPTDQVDHGDDKWRPASGLEFLEMFWEVALNEEENYGPTTIGTLREFLKEGLISPETTVTNVHQKQSMLLRELLGYAETPPPAPPKIQDAAHLAAIAKEMQEVVPINKLPAVERAKSQRMRQLEEDLRHVRKENEELLQKYRKLNQQYVDIKSGKK